MTPEVQLVLSTATPTARRRVEIVERKGLGHPDTICDSVAEAVSHALCRAYLESAGRVLHHNVDKALLVAGASEPRPGGGRIVAPMRLVLGDRATAEWDGHRLPVGEIVKATAERWFREHLRFVDPSRHLLIDDALRPGSPQLVDVFARDALGANDTSVGVGYAPLTETERLVLAAEHLVNSPSFKEIFPEAGEDVKVMATRVERRLELTLAVAVVDRFVPDERTYFERKNAMRERIVSDLGARLVEIDSLEVGLNALDRRGRGSEGMYLTVLGTSAEGADGGEVGRGNRVNGLIPFHRPHSMEAAAGKNPVCHVGKIYNALAPEIAARIHAEIDGLEEVRVFLCSRIGDPVDRPRIASAELSLAEGVALTEIEDRVRSIVARELAGTGAFVERLVRGEIPVC